MVELPEWCGLAQSDVPGLVLDGSPIMCNGVMTSHQQLDATLPLTDMATPGRSPNGTTMRLHVVHHLYGCHDGLQNGDERGVKKTDPQSNATRDVRWASVLKCAGFSGGLRWVVWDGLPAMQRRHSEWGRGRLGLCWAVQGAVSRALLRWPAQRRRDPSGERPF